MNIILSFQHLNPLIYNVYNYTQSTPHNQKAALQCINARCPLPKNDIFVPGIFFRKKISNRTKQQLSVAAKDVS